MNTLTLRSPGDMVALVPYLLGFHPGNSLVLLGQHGARVTFQARCDIPPPDTARRVAAHVAAVAARQGPSAVVLIGYGDADTTSAALDVLRDAVTATGLVVHDVLRVHDGRYWSLVCTDTTCCPPEGTAVDVSASRVAAAATYEGMVALPDRAALAQRLAPVPGPGIEPELAAARERLRELPGGARRRRVAARVAVREALDRYRGGGRLDDDEVAWLALLLHDLPARDDAWQRMLAADPADTDDTLWRDLVRRVPSEHRPAPATLLALVAWRAGDGVSASIAAEHALAADPRYTLADLVLQALHAAIPPTALEPMPRPAGRRSARVRPAGLGSARVRPVEG